MKVYIFTDMEGVGGVVEWEQAMPQRPGYEEARELLAGEMNSAVRGAFEGGADEVIVRDGHYMGRNFIMEKLEPRAKYYVGRAPALTRMPGIEGSDVMFCIGYHARANTPSGILCHTMDGTNVASFRVNGREYGELGMDALWAGLHGVGVGMVSGDDALAREAKELFGDVEAAVVKQGSTRFGGFVIPPSEARAMIHRSAAAATRKAAEKKPAPLSIKPPYCIELDVVGQEILEKKLTLVPGARRKGASTLAVEGEDLNYLMFAVLV